MPPSYARLSPLAKGRIVGLREADTPRDDILKLVRKKDGKAPSLHTVDAVLERFRADPEWDGLEERTAGGRPQDLTPKPYAETWPQRAGIRLEGVIKLTVDRPPSRGCERQYSKVHGRS